MVATTLILSLFLTAPTDCYLVTNHDIQRIPCDFRASATDALRYGGAPPRTAQREQTPASGPEHAATAAAPPRPPRQDLKDLSPDALREVYEAEKRRMDEAKAAGTTPPKAFGRGRRRANDE